MTTPEVIQLISNLGFPIVLTAGLLWWLGTQGMPRVATTVEKLMDSFRQELAAERAAHREEINRFFEVQKSEHNEIIRQVCEKADQIKGSIRDRQ